jgi:SgrR family transcriptional regulator
LNLTDAIAGAMQGDSAPITVEELVEIFGCTDRNAKLILRKMEESGWIAWKPGRGRGNKSTIRLLADRDRLLFELAKREVDQGNVREGLALVQLRGRGPEEIARFSEWLTEFFGYRKEGGLDRPLDTLRVPVTFHVGSLDPTNVYFVGEGHLMREIYDTLVGYDYVNEALVPKLAHHWEANDDNTEWTFYLRKGVQFHHRREMTADDVVFTFSRLRNHHLYFVIKNVAAAGPLTVKFELVEPIPWFPRMVSFDSTSILPRDLVAERGPAFFDVPVGTGPFQMVKRTPALCILDAFPAHYSGRPHLDRVELHMMPQHEAGLGWDMSYRSLDGAPSMESWKRIRTSIPCCKLLTFNLQLEGPQRQQAFRRAIDAALDRTEMLQARGDERFSTAFGFTPECGTPTLASTAASEEDIARLIRELLSASGYDGSELTLSATPTCFPDAELIQERCGRYGIRIRLQPRDFNEIADSLRSPNVHMMIQNIVFEDEELTFLDFVFSRRSAIGFHLLEERTQEIGKEYMRSMFAEDRSSARWGWVRKLSDLVRESGAILFLFHFNTDAYYSPRIRGVRLNSLGLIDFRNVWFKDQ